MCIICMIVCIVNYDVYHMYDRLYRLSSFLCLQLLPVSVVKCSLRWCSFTRHHSQGKSLYQSQQYEILVRPEGGKNSLHRQSAVPLTIRIPAFTAIESGGGTHGLGSHPVFGQHVLFHANSTQWHEESQEVVEQVACLLRAKPHLRIQVRGHSNGGMGNLNMEDELSWTRAANVCECLVSNGARPGQLELEGCGSQHMFVPPTGQQNYRNRRVEFVPLPESRN